MRFTYRPPSLSRLPHDRLAQETDKGMARIYEAVGNLSQTLGSPVDGVIPTPTADGVTKVFTWPSVPDPPASLKVFVGGILLMAGGDYTLNGAVITFIVPPILNANIVGWYRTK